MTRETIIVGIDPAFRQKGFTIAIVDENREIAFKTFKNGFYDFVGWLMNDCPDNAIFGIENSNLQKAVFKKGTGVSVGKNQAASQYTVDACRLFYPKTTYEWSPKDKGKKLSHMEILGLCNQNRWKLPKKTTNQDERDALKMADLARLTYHRNIFKR